MGQRFIARDRREFSNGAIGWAPGGPFDCIGPYAKVQNCPVMLDDAEIGRYTCYATRHADSMFSIPACTKVLGTHIGGFFTTDGGSPVFHPHGRYKALLTTLVERLQAKKVRRE